MITTDSYLFYAELGQHNMSAAELLNSSALFNAVPENWHVIITDIKNSTKQVIEGQYQTVNLVATGSIATVLNIVFSADLDVPFFFGGDGATFIVPDSITGTVMEALNLYKANTLTNFGMDMRVGIVPVSNVYKEGFDLRIAKLSTSSIFSIPVIIGNGLMYAEKIVKGDGYLLPEYVQQASDVDLRGMQCRWDKIAPPENQEEVVTLIVIANKENTQQETFRKVMLKIDEIYGTQEERQPISVRKLRMKTTFKRMRTEILARFGKLKLFQLLETALIDLYGYIYLRTKRGKKYLEGLVAMSDTLVIDGKINTVMSGTSLQRNKLEKFLNELESSKEITYGLHISKTSVMSCYVRNMDNGHIHFVDGADGGYTKAAKVLKGKLGSMI